MAQLRRQGCPSAMGWGAAIAGRRDRVILATKFGYVVDEQQRIVTLGNPRPDHTRLECEARRWSTARCASLAGCAASPMRLGNRFQLRAINESQDAMNTSPKSARLTALSILLLSTVFSAALVSIIALTYSYNTLSLAASGVGFLSLLAAGLFLWLYRKRAIRQGYVPAANRAITAGIELGVLWVTEISINNFVAPPLPARDMIDNIFWAGIALMEATLKAYKRGHSTVFLDRRFVSDVREFTSRGGPG